MANKNSIDISTAVKTSFSKYADFEGRATRPEFWWFLLFLFIVSVALSALNFTTPAGEVEIGTSLSAFWVIATLLPMFAALVRRLRDSNHAWTNLFWLFLPIAGLIVMVIYLCEPTKGE